MPRPKVATGFSLRFVSFPLVGNPAFMATVIKERFRTSRNDSKRLKKLIGFL
jgi:hypothetical protein